MCFCLRVKEFRRQVEAVVPHDGAHVYPDRREGELVAQSRDDRPQIGGDEIPEIDLAFRAVGEVRPEAKVRQCFGFGYPDHVCRPQTSGAMRLNVPVCAILAPEFYQLFGHA